MKRNLLILVILLIAIFATSCSNQDNTDQEKNNSNTQSVTDTLTVEVDEKIQKALDIYVRITMENDVTAVDELPQVMWDILSNSADEYKTYMQSNPPENVSENINWSIVSVVNSVNNVYDVEIVCNGETQMLTITVEDNAAVIDELINYLQTMSLNMS